MCGLAHLWEEGGSLAACNEPVDKARKQGILAGGGWATCKEPVESIPPRQKRTDNEKRKSDSHEETTIVNISYDETGEPCVDSHTCEEPVEYIPQAEFKPPSEYVRMAMKAHS